MKTAIILGIIFIIVTVVLSLLSRTPEPKQEEENTYTLEYKSTFKAREWK